MQMTMRWYGSQYDTVTLQQIRQTAYVKIISTLYNKMPVSCGLMRRLWLLRGMR